MIALQFEFVAGRFHANPWVRGADEGEIEWPPSPWHLLRAVVAGWCSAGAPQRDILLTMLDGLAEPPTFLLPRATAGRTRHYMQPVVASKNGKSERTSALDSFIAPEKERDSVAYAYAAWPQVDLSVEQRALLSRCCTFITHFGRAESRCTVSVVDVVPSGDGLARIDLASRSTRDGPAVRRLAAGPSHRGERLLSGLTGPASEALGTHSMPLGTVVLEYRLPPDFLMVREQYDRLDRSRPVFGPSLLRFALERGRHSPKPSIADTLVFGELLRASAMQRFSDREGEPATYRLAGKDDGGSGARVGHDHPYFLPYDYAGRGEIDGIDVWLPRGCTHAEYTAVTSVIELREHVVYKDTYPLTFIGMVQRPLSAVWQSATPLVLERFPKIRGTNGSRRMVDAPHEQVVEMLRRGMNEPARISIWEASRGIDRAHGGHLRIDAFRRARVRKNTPPLPVAAATIEFDEPVEGPIILGRLAHFGLGRFEPVPSQT